MGVGGGFRIIYDNRVICSSGCDFQWSPYLFFLIVLKVGTVVAVGDGVATNPICSTVTPLGFYSCHFHFLPKIHLQKLVSVSGSGTPSIPTREMKSGIFGGVPAILGGSCDLGIRYASFLHPECP